MKVVDRFIKDLKPAEYNPRFLTKKQEDNLTESLSKFGIIDPIIINVNKDRKDVVIGGHQRLKIWTKLGNKKIPCVELNLDLSEEKELNVRLNKNTGDFDFMLLKEHFEIDELLDWGFEDFELGIDLGIEDEEKEKKDRSGLDEIDTDVEVITKEGDVWQLGKHKIICGSSKDPNVIKKLLKGRLVNLHFSDPPYGMKKEKDGVTNDNLNFNELLEFNKIWIKNAFDTLDKNGSFYCWGTDEPLMDIYSEILKPKIRDKEITFRNLITWDKGNGQGQNSENTRMYAVADEKCLFVMNGTQGFDTNSYNYYEGFEPIREYLVEQFKAVGGDKKGAEILGVSKRMVEHYTKKSQWDFISKERFDIMQDYCLSNNINAFKDYDKIKKEFYDSRAYFNNVHDNFNNVWHFTRHQKNGEEGGHATPKPIELCERAILSSSREGDLVADFFGGSGSTLIACEITGREARLVELEPKWVDVTVKRWEEMTGKKAKLLK